jgi:hypothetical protein
MAARPDLDLAAGSEKGELDAALLPCANVVRSNGLPKKREPYEVSVFIRSGNLTSVNSTRPQSVKSIA